MNRASRVTLLALAALVVAFIATWVTIPSGSTDAVSAPASLLMGGLKEYQSSICIDWEGPNCARRAPINPFVDIDRLEQRVRYVFGGTAVVIVLVGLAFGAGRRKSAAAA